MEIGTWKNVDNFKGKVQNKFKNVRTSSCETFEKGLKKFWVNLGNVSSKLFYEIFAEIFKKYSENFENRWALISHNFFYFFFVLFYYMASSSQFGKYDTVNTFSENV